MSTATLFHASAWFVVAFVCFALLAVMAADRHEASSGCRPQLRAVATAFLILGCVCLLVAFGCACAGVVALLKSNGFL